MCSHIPVQLANDSVANVSGRGRAATLGPSLSRVNARKKHVISGNGGRRLGSHRTLVGS